MEFSLTINKIMCTSSFVIFAGGRSMLCYFYGLIDCYRITNWSKPLLWIGSNSILIYVAAHGLVNFESTSQFLFGGMISNANEAWQQVILWCGVLLNQLILLRFLSKNVVFKTIRK